VPDPGTSSDGIVDVAATMPSPRGFAVEREVGRGPGYRRYRGTQTSLGRPALLTVIDPVLAAVGGFDERFAEDWRAVGELEHPAVVPVYDVGEHQGLPYVLTADPADTDLERLLESGGPLPSDAAAGLAAAIGGALDAAHARGVVHGDVGPANVLVSADGEHAYLTGFGVAGGGRREEDIAGLADLLRRAAAYEPFEPIIARAEAAAADHGAVSGSALGHAARAAAGAAPAARSGATRPKRTMAVAAVVAGLAAAALLVFAWGRETPPADFPAPATQSFRVGTQPWGIVAAAGSVWVADNRDGTVTRLDAQTGRMRGDPLPVGRAPTAMTAGAGMIWVALAGNGTVVAIDEVTGRRDGEPIAVGVPLALLYAAGRVWVYGRDGRLRALDPAERRVVGRPRTVGSVGDATTGGLAHGAGRLWITEFSDGTVTPIDPASGRPVGRPLPTGDGAEGVAVAGGRVWVVNGQEETVVALDPDSGARIGRPIRMPRYPLAIEAFAGSLWVANGDDTVTRIDARTGRVQGRPIPVGDDPYEFAVADGSLWVTNNDDHTVTRITP
jgi:DNA-binding beta-propeller fold protein YncE